MLKSPNPQLKQRLYNGRRIPVYEGRVKVEDISGWVDNPRIDLAKKALKDRVGQREPTQEEIFELMKSSAEVKLKLLRDDIMKNGLREPLTLSHNGKLLDGNRRFFALKYALETLSATDPNRQDFETVNAFVLTELASEKDEEDVLVEENFSASLKIEWPDYVKARKVIAAHEEGVPINDIAKRFAWSLPKVKETIKINSIVDDFLAFAVDPSDPADPTASGLGLSEHEAELVASKNYQLFNEAQKSFYGPLTTDFDFKINFFRWIHQGKFSSFQETRIAHKAWCDPEARPILMGPEPAAAKSAKAVLDYNERVVRSSSEAIGRIEAFTKFLQQLEVQEVIALPNQAKDKLKEALATVIKMSDVANGTS